MSSASGPRGAGGGGAGAGAATMRGPRPGVAPGTARGADLGTGTGPLPGLRRGRTEPAPAAVRSRGSGWWRPPAEEGGRGGAMAPGQSGLSHG